MGDKNLTQRRRGLCAFALKFFSLFLTQDTMGRAQGKQEKFMHFCEQQSEGIWQKPPVGMQPWVHTPFWQTCEQH